MKGSWGAYMQQGELESLNMCGGELSKHIHCSVHYPAYNKPYFECRHGIVFPSYAVKGALETDNWTDIITKHTNEQEIIEWQEYT